MKRGFYRRVCSLAACTAILAFFLILALNAQAAGVPQNRKICTSYRPANTIRQVLHTDTPADERYSWVKMPTEHRQMVLEACDAYKVSPDLAFAVIWVESRNTAGADNGQCVGYMQINLSNNERFRARLGVPNVREPIYNIQCGVSFLSELIKKHGDERLALMYYNEGTEALRKWAAGVRESGYTQRVAAAKEAIHYGKN